MSRRLGGTLKLVVAVAIVVALVATDRLSLSAMAPVFARPSTLATLIGLQVAILAVGVWRWQVLLSAISARRQSFRDLLAFNWIGQFFGTFAPSTVATDVTRFTYIVRSGAAAPKTVLASLLIDRAAGTLGTLALALILARRLVLDSLSHSVAVIFAATVGLVIVAVIASRRSREVARVAAAARGASLFAVACAMVAMALKVACIWLIIRAVEPSVPVADVFSVAPVGFLVEAIPLAPGGMGTAHLAFDYLLGLKGIVAGAALFNVYFAIRIFVSLVGGLLWAMQRVGARKRNTGSSVVTTSQRSSSVPPTKPGSCRTVVSLSVTSCVSRPWPRSCQTTGAWCAGRLSRTIRFAPASPRAIRTPLASRSGRD